MRYGFWTTEKDRQIQRLEAAGFSAAQIADRLGTTRNAVIGRSARLRGLVFQSQREKERRERATRAERLRKHEQGIADTLAQMRRAMAKGVPRNVAIVSAVKAHATYQSVGDELGLSRQRVEQIVSRRGRE
jgi:hypothetical protein